MKGITKVVLSLGVVAGGYGLFKLIGKEPSKYSLDWIKSLSDTQWESEREKVCQIVCSPKYSDALRESFRKILNLFDKVKSDRDWAGQKPQGPAFHREHGWYL